MIKTRFSRLSSLEAAKWSKGLFKEEFNTDIFFVIIWLEFNELFCTHFFPINTTTETTNKLGEIIYY